MTDHAPANYSIPLKYRVMENLHIVFWLLKDISWCLLWKPLGILMIFPTLIVSLVIAWRTRHMFSELCHNVAISFWITANSYWMISEFFHFDEKSFHGWFEFRLFAVVPFGLGILILAFYYIIWLPRHRSEINTM